MRRIRLTVSYDGTAYCGSQIQPNGPTVEEKLNDALTRLTGEPVRVILASRTDAGVHALGNAAVFDTSMRMAADKFAVALNQRLPADIRVQRSEEVPEDWHPRKQNCTKTYLYRIWNSRTPDPLVRLYSAFCYYRLDLGKMRRAAACLTGEHDFAAFCSARSQAENTVRTIDSIECFEERPSGGVCPEQDGSGRMIAIRISGSGFLYNMVRIIAGTLLQIGEGIRPAEDMRKILASRDRGQAGPVAPAAGLTLLSIRFEPRLVPHLAAENEDWSWELDQAETAGSGVSRLTIRFCRRPADYAPLLTRLLHQAHRNGAASVLVRDLESPDRPGTGREYGFYVLRDSDDPAYPFLARDRKETENTD